MTDMQIFRSCVIKGLPRVGRKIWPSFYLDLKFVQLGLKKASLFDYASITSEDLNSLLIAIRNACQGDTVCDGLLAATVGEDIFIVNYRRFCEHCTQIESTYFADGPVRDGKGLLLDVSTDVVSPTELKSKQSLDELRSLITELKKTLLNLEYCGASAYSLLNESEGQPWCAIYGMLLNYPIVYWLKTHACNLVGTHLINYQVKIKKEELFGIKVPKNYTVLSFTIPESISSYGQSVVSNWYSSISGATTVSEPNSCTFYLAKETKFVSQISL